MIMYYSIRNKINGVSLFYLISIIFFFALVLPYLSQAQVSFNNIEVKSSPQFPGAYEEVELDLTSFSFDLDRSIISWAINGNLLDSGIGKKQFTFTTGALGSISTINVSVQTAIGQQFTKNVVIQPQSVDLLWDAFTYTPPFYKGKALPSSKSFTIVTALPELTTRSGVKLNPKNLVYTWEEGGFILGNLSGFGKQSVIIENATIPKLTKNVAVTISSFDNSIQVRKSINIKTYSPNIVLYKKHPLNGILYENALNKNVTLSEKELVIRSEPYFFSLDDVNSDKLRYRWRINGRDISVPLNEQRNEMIFRQEGEESGTAEISLFVRNGNLKKILQEAQKKVLIMFGL